MSTYKDHYYTRYDGRGEPVVVCTYSWRTHTHRNLAWRYGEARAAVIMAGQDKATQDDIAAWNRLGTRAAA